MALKTPLGNGLDEIGEGQTPSGLQRAPSRGEADGTPVGTPGQGSLLDRLEGMETRRWQPGDTRVWKDRCPGGERHSLILEQPLPKN